MPSIWTESTELPAFHSLHGDIKTDVLIIGGGMAGLLCALLLHKKGVNYTLAEASRLCGGVTKNTTAKITVQHGLVYDKLLKNAGREKAAMYLSANQAALERFRQLAPDMDCDFEEKDAYVYSLTGRKEIENEIEALGKLGLFTEFAEDLPLPFKTQGAVRLRKQAQFNPLKFAAAASKDLNILENTMVMELRGSKAITEKGTITAKKVIVATHFPFINKHGSYFLKMYQHRSYAIALEGAPDVKGMYVDAAEKGMSFRNYNGLLLLGGGDHKTGKRGGAWQELRAFAQYNYAGAAEKCHWATQDCMTLDAVPYIGPYSKNTPGLFVATGFNKWGMTSAMAAAMILSDLACGGKNENAEVFSPSRSMIKPQLAANAAAATAGWLTPTLNRCPHLGCALKYNSVEQSWDCPCHGSRFDLDGTLIDNPATGDWKKAPARKSSPGGP